MPLTTYTAGDVLTAASLNANLVFAAANPTAPAVAIFNETQASGTSGGGFTSGSFLKRTLNTTIVNQITGCTLTSSVIALPAGTYQVLVFAPAFKVVGHKARLQNTTDGTTIALGQSALAAAVDDAETNAVLQTVFTLTATKNVEVQHQAQTTSATQGFGRACSFGVDEIYTIIQIVKLS